MPWLSGPPSPADRLAVLRRAFAGQAALLLASAAVGVVVSASRGGRFLPGWWQFDWATNTGHVMFGLLAVLFASAHLSLRVLRNASLALSLTFAGLAVAGSLDVHAYIFKGLKADFEVLENLLHSVVALIGLAAWQTTRGTRPDST